MGITRDILRKVYTHIKEQLMLNGVVARNLGSIKAVDEAFKRLFDEYADKKYSSLKAELKSFIEENKKLKTVNDKLSDENCKLNREKARLTAKNEELEIKNDVLRVKNEELKDDNASMNARIKKLEKDNKRLQEENDYHCKPWYEKIFG